VSGITPPKRENQNEVDARNNLLDILSSNPVNKEEILLNLGLFIDPSLMSRLLFLNYLYGKIVATQGVIMDIGTRWGHNAVVLSTLRSIYEPYNHQRKVIAFDTFSGFKGANHLDGKQLCNVDGQYSTTIGYEKILENLLNIHEKLHPLDHIRKNEVIKGDVSETIPQYITDNPETIISLAYFDVDLYKPTYDSLVAIQDRLTIGSILAFDELNYHGAPGETLALLNTLGIRNVAVRRFPMCSRVSYIEVI
jgi:hypothetical protein